jgi:hypothetical protein
MEAEEGRMRDEFPAAVRDDLAKRAAFLCCSPACRQPTSGPRATESGSVNIGVAAHITAASEGGPRYDPSLSSAERASGENGIWLCQTCAKLVDNDPSRYSAEKLREWRSDAETAAAHALEQRRAPATESQGVLREAERLMPELIAEMRDDVRGDTSKLVREFAVLPSTGVIFNSTKARFAYYESQHPDLILQADWLEEMGLIVDVTPSNVPIYRMMPEFVEWLREPT